MNDDVLRALSPGRDFDLGRGGILFRAGDRSLGLVLVRSGALELVRMSQEGRRMVLHRAGPGETFAEPSLFENQHHCDAVAALPSRVTVYPASDVRRAAEADPSLGWRIATHLATRLIAERARSERLALPHAADRILDVLHALPPEADGARRLERPWKALAAELGLTHEATYRALARLERQGRLRRERDGRVRLPTEATAESVRDADAPRLRKG